MALNPFEQGAYQGHGPLAQQSPPIRWRPEWLVGHLVFQGGNPRLKQSSMTGGGFIALGNAPRGRQQPSTQTYATPVSSAVGGGNVPSRPNYTTGLLGGAVARGNF
jgi:hypothetical protein